MRAFLDKNGMPKSHRRRGCKECLEFPKGGCMLPFRKLRQVRRWKAMQDKPILFKSRVFKNFFG